VIQSLSVVLLCGALALHVWATETLGKVFALQSTAYGAIMDVLQDNLVQVTYLEAHGGVTHSSQHNTSVQHIVAPG